MKGNTDTSLSHLGVLLLKGVVVADDAARLVAVLVDEDGLVRQVAQRGEVLLDVQDMAEDLRLGCGDHLR